MIANLRFHLSIIVLLVTPSFFGLTFGNFNAEYQGPSAESLVGYWPFDNVSKFDEFSYKWSANFYADWYYLTSLQSGPFANDCQPSYSILATSPITTLVSYETAELPGDFTIAFYFYNSNRPNANVYTPYTVMTNFFYFGNGASNSPAFSVRYSRTGYSFYVNHKAPENETSTPLDGPEIEFRPQKWNFIAMTFDNSSSKSLKFYTSSGAVLKSFPIEKGVPQLKNLMIGTLASGDRIYCFIIYEKAIKQAEIARLPCVCRSRGDCRDGLPYKVSNFEYKGPRFENLVGYWPMFESEDQLGGGLNDVIEGRAPFEIDAVDLQLPRNTQAAGPPFTGAPRRLNSAFYTPDVQKWVASFSNVKMTQNFTIIFYLYRPKGRQINSVLIHTWNRLIVKAEGNFLEIHAGTSGGLETLLAMPEVVPQTGNDWNFVAISYDYEAKILRFFNESGGEIWQQNGTFLQVESPVDLSVGPAWPEDSSMACLALFNSTLEGVEIAKMRQVCRQSGIPRAFWPEKDFKFSGPNGTSLLGYWPLFEDQNNCELVETSQSPIGSVETKTARLFSLPNDDAFLICYPNGEMADSEIGDSFTVAFHLYTRQDFRTSERFGFIYISSSLYLTLAYQGDWLVVIGTRVGGTRVIIAKSQILSPKNGGEWNFAAITYEGSVISLYTEGGRLLSVHRVPRLWSNGTVDYVRIGPTSRETGLACLTIYGTVLSSEEIARLECFCDKARGETCRDLATTLGKGRDITTLRSTLTRDKSAASSSVKIVPSFIIINIIIYLHVFLSC